MLILKVRRILMKIQMTFGQTSVLICLYFSFNYRWISITTIKIPVAPARLGNYHMFYKECLYLAVIRSVDYDEPIKIHCLEKVVASEILTGRWLKVDDIHGRAPFVWKKNQQLLDCYMVEKGILLWRFQK